jgi:hypothetical protein
MDMDINIDVDMVMDTIIGKERRFIGNNDIS